MNIPRFALAVSLMAGLSLNSSCYLFQSPSGAELSKQVTGLLADLIEDVPAVDTELEELESAIDSISSSDELLEAKYERLTGSIAKLRKHMKSVESQFARQETVQASYKEVWGEQLDGITDAAMRGKSEERLRTVSSSFQRQDETAQAVMTKSTPLLEELANIEKSLSLDLSPAGIESVKQNLDDAKAKAKELRAALSSASASMKDTVDVLGNS